HRHQLAESRRRILARARTPERDCRRETAVPHDHSRIPHAEWRTPGSVRGYGGSDPAAEPRADARAAAHVRHESPSRARRATMEGDQRKIARPRVVRIA